MNRFYEKYQSQKEFSLRILELCNEKLEEIQVFLDQLKKNQIKIPSVISYKILVTIEEYQDKIQELQKEIERTNTLMSIYADVKEEKDIINKMENTVDELNTYKKKNEWLKKQIKEYKKKLRGQERKDQEL
jgi:type I site-specific restriction-modification system R (restriction) subunit